MEVRFASNRLGRCADDYREEVREWGAPVARRYISRVRVLRDAAAFRDLWSNRSLRLHPLSGQRQGQYAIDLTNRWRLIVVPDQSGNGLVIAEVTQHYDG